MTMRRAGTTAMHLGRVQRVSALGFFVLTLTSAFVSPSAEAQHRRRREPAPQPSPSASPDVAPNPFGDPAQSGTQVNAAGSAASTSAQTSGASATSAATPVDASASQAPPETTLADLAPLRAEYTGVMDDLVRARARIATLGRALFQTRVRISVQNRAGDTQALARVTVELDGAQVFRAEGGELRDDASRQVFEGFAAPGPHVVAIEVEQRARASDTYRYTSRQSFRFEVVRERLTEGTLVLDDDSDIAEDFPDDGEGEYDVRTRFRVATRALNAR